MDFEPALYGALAALIRQLRTKEAPQVFADSLSVTVTTLSSILPAFSECLLSEDIALWERSTTPLAIQRGVVLLRRLSRAISSLESKQADISDVNMGWVQRIVRSVSSSFL